MFRLSAIAVAFSLFCSPVMATPILSGSYAALYQQFCQVVVDVNKDTGEIKFDRESTEGTYAAVPSTIAFNQDGTYTWNGIADAVSTVLESFSDGSKKGHQGKSYTFTESGSFSNTGTTLTIDGVVYDVVYGHVDQNNTADSFMATIHLPLPHVAANHCVVTIQGQIQ